MASMCHDRYNSFPKILSLDDFSLIFERWISVDPMVTRNEPPLSISMCICSRLTTNRYADGKDLVIFFKVAFLKKLENV